MTKFIRWLFGLCPLCGDTAYGPQYPDDYVKQTRGWAAADRLPYCYGPCCPGHGGPREGEPIIFKDGYTPEGRPMWCAVMPGFENLQESPAGFSGNPVKAVAELRAAIAKALNGAGAG